MSLFYNKIEYFFPLKFSDISNVSPDCALKGDIGLSVGQLVHACRILVCQLVSLFIHVGYWFVSWSAC
jgi:hypothetical protein